MRWITIVTLALILSACGTLCNNDNVSYRSVEVDPTPPMFVIDDSAPVDVTTTQMDYY